MSDSPTLFIYVCFCGSMGGVVALTNTDYIPFFCRGCKETTVAQAFVSVGSRVSVRNFHERGHGLYRVTHIRPASSNEDSRDYHVSAECETCGSSYTVGPNDTSPPWYNWVVHNKLNLNIPSYNRQRIIMVGR